MVSREAVRFKWEELKAYREVLPHGINKWTGEKFPKYQPQQAVTEQLLRREYNTLKQLTVIPGDKQL